MTIATERLTYDTIVDENGNVLPAADVTDGSLPPTNAFLIGRDHVLPARRRSEAIDEQNAVRDTIEDKNPGPHMTFAEYYLAELALLDATSGISMRGGFDKAKDYDAGVHNRYRDRLPAVVAGAKANAHQLATTGIRRIYMGDELVAAGFSEIDVNDGVNAMRALHRKAYGGPGNKNKRAARRKHLLDKLAQLGHTTPETLA